MKPKSFTRQFTVRTALLAGAVAAGEQTADHGGGESGEADLPVPQARPAAESPSKQPVPAPRSSLQALTRVLPSSSK